MRHRIRSGLFAGALALGSLLAVAPTPAATDASAPRCDAPADLTRLDLPLRRTARRLAAHRFVVIVALGSSSTAGGTPQRQIEPGEIGRNVAARRAHVGCCGRRRDGEQAR